MSAFPCSSVPGEPNAQPFGSTPASTLGNGSLRPAESGLQRRYWLRFQLRIAHSRVRGEEKMWDTPRLPPELGCCIKLPGHAHDSYELVRLVVLVRLGPSQGRNCALWLERAGLCSLLPSNRHQILQGFKSCSGRGITGQVLRWCKVM